MALTIISRTFVLLALLLLTGCSDSPKIDGCTRTRVAVEGEQSRAHSELRWTQTLGAWIAAVPGHPDIRGEAQTKPIDPRGEKLVVRLLGVGGKMVCVPYDEDFELCEQLAESGALIQSDTIEEIAGGRSQCHSNAARLYLSDPDNYSIATGYGLTEDDAMWRRHSWLVRDDGALVETTVKRQMYFGIVLGRQDALRFCGPELKQMQRTGSEPEDGG